MAYEGGTLWTLLKRGIADLIDNQDLIESADRNYIVGYLCRVVVKGLSGESAAKPGRRTTTGSLNDRGRSKT